MYSEKNIMTTKEHQFIDQMVNDVFGKVQDESENWTSRIFLLGMLLMVYSKLREKTDKLQRISELDFTLKTLLGETPLTAAQKTIPHIESVLPIDKDQLRVLQLAEQNIGTYITNISDKTRKEIRETIIHAQMSKMHPQQLSHELHKRFGFLNKNWRLIAVTENAAIAANGFMSMLREGDKVTAHSLSDACPWCLKMLDGKTFTFTENPPISDTDSKWQTHVWIGKTNFGRKRNAWSPVIPLHPGCRCWFSHGGK